jgi:hypothetical protein
MERVSIVKLTAQDNSWGTREQLAGRAGWGQVVNV